MVTDVCVYRVGAALIAAITVKRKEKGIMPDR
jgi:hypothetical protein